MNLSSKPLTKPPSPRLFTSTTRSRSSTPNTKWLHNFHSSTAKCLSVRNHEPLLQTPEQVVDPGPDVNSGVAYNPEKHNLENVEVLIEKVIYSCRFFAILAVWGSLVGSFLCFFKGCVYVVTSFQEYTFDRTRVISSLVQATDVYLLGTVMLVFGMGLYELFISNLDKQRSLSTPYRSNLFGLFVLKERPRWLEIKTVNELKTKLGHVIVMLLLIGLFDKSKKAIIQTPLDLLCFAASVLLSSGCLFLLSRLND